MNRLTERVNYGSSWVEDIETDGYIPLNYSTGTTTGKCVDKLGTLEDIFELIEEMYKNSSHNSQWDSTPYHVYNVFQMPRDEVKYND